MKFHETHFEEYLTSCEKYNIHPEIDPLVEVLPDHISKFEDLIIYGPSGSGKYTQMLRLIKKYSPSALKYDKRMTMQTDKHEYIYRISDVHYEIDMALLGCNSKIIWHEVFGQIVDIVSMKSDKNGIIVCKNFHMIHTELLDIFYSYMQQYHHPSLAIQIKFILILEHISFLPNSILHHCRVVNIKRPSKTDYVNMISKQRTNGKEAVKNDSNDEDMDQANGSNLANVSTDLLNTIDPAYILNLKEIYSFPLVQEGNDPPKEIFNVICDAIIQEMMRPEKIVITEFRDSIYDILVYNLDVSDCVWYILSYFISSGRLSKESISVILDKTMPFFKQFNNNYRPIYHLESMFICMLNHMHGYVSV